MTCSATLARNSRISGSASIRSVRFFESASGAATPAVSM